MLAPKARQAAVGCAFSLPKTELGTLVGAGLMACRAAGLLSARSRRPCGLAGERARRTWNLGGPTHAWDPHLARGTYCLAMVRRARGVVSRHP